MAVYHEGQGGSTESEIEIGPMFRIVEDGDNVQIDTLDDSMSDNEEPLDQLIEDDNCQKMDHDDDSNDSNDNTEDNKINGVSDKLKATPKRMKRRPKKTKFTNADLINNTIPRRHYGGRTGNIRDADQWIHDRIRAYDFTKDGTHVVVRGQLKYRCNTCQSTMVTKSGLFHHVLLHTGEKPYICKFENCGVAYTQPAGRMVHEMNHTKAESKRNSYKSMKAAEDKKDLKVIDDYIKRAQKSLSPSPPLLHPETTLIRSKRISENLMNNGQGSGPALSKITIQLPTTTTPQKKISGQDQNDQIIVIDSSPSPSPEKKIVRQHSNSNNGQNHNVNTQIDKKEINHSTGQSQDPGQVSKPPSQFEELKRFIQFSILESESRVMARLDDIEDKMDDFCDQMKIHEGKIDFMEKKIDYLAKQNLSN